MSDLLEKAKKIAEEVNLKAIEEKKKHKQKSDTLNSLSNKVHSFLKNKLKECDGVEGFKYVDSGENGRGKVIASLFKNNKLVLAIECFQDSWENGYSDESSFQEEGVRIIIYCDMINHDRSWGNKPYWDICGKAFEHRTTFYEHSKVMERCCDDISRHLAEHV